MIGGLLAVARRPGLWRDALSQWRALTPARWWSRWPHLPVPARAYLSFRLEAMYGPRPGRRGRARPARLRQLRPAEVVAYLEWCRRMRTLAR